MTRSQRQGILYEFVKGRGLPIGTIRTHGGKKVIKAADGQWKRYSAEHAAKQGKQVKEKIRGCKGSRPAKGVAQRSFLLFSLKNQRKVKSYLYNPYADSEILDLLPGAEINYEGGTLTNLRWGGYQQYQSGSSNHPSLPLRASRLHIYYDDLANSYLIDYATGYDNASRVPDDLKELVAKVLAIKIMSAYGDGIVSGLASFSIGVGVLHESVNTTMSAASAFFGARIKQFQEEIKDWMQRHKNRYSHPGITHL